MSKIVRGIGKAVSGVVKGVKKIARSKVGRVLVTAAAVYFGGAALMGAMGAGGAAAAAGTSGLAGAAANVSAAWGSLWTAGSALASGNLSGAAGALGTGMSGGVAGAAQAAAPAAGWTASSTGLNVLASEAPAAAASKGIIGSVLGSSPYAAPAMISAGTQLIGGAMQGIGQQRALREQREYDLEQAAAQRERYNTNMGTSLWGPAPTGPQPPVSPLPPVTAPPAVQAPQTPVAGVGIVNRYMNPGAPMAGVQYFPRVG